MQQGHGNQKPRFKPFGWTARSQQVLIPSAVTQIVTSSTVGNAFQKEPHLSASHTLSVPFPLGAGSPCSVQEFNTNPPNGGDGGLLCHLSDDQEEEFSDAQKGVISITEFREHQRIKLHEMTDFPSVIF